MNLAQFVTLMDDQIELHENKITKPRAALLVWFLINYYRLDEETASFSVCDNDNDKGIDGVYVDDQTQEVYIFQSKYSDKAASSQGDTELRDLKGSSSWLTSPASLAILKSAPAYSELKSLLDRLEVFDRIAQGYKLRLTFVTNRRFNKQAIEYIKVLGDEIEPWDVDRLYAQFIYSGKDKPVKHTFVFELDDDQLISYKTSDELKIVVFPAKVTDIVKLEGIQDRTLFAKNVRYGLGRTRVNREIETTLKDDAQHENFFFYHNGITLLCSGFELKGKKLRISNYSIVNGCQSTLSFYQNRPHLSDKIKVLLRVIQTSDKDNISQDITYFTNNQNAISVKDLKSNDKIQRD